MPMRPPRALASAALLAIALHATSACTPLPEHRPAPAPQPVPGSVEALAGGERVQLTWRPAGRDVRLLRGRLVATDAAALRVAADQGDTVSIDRAELRGLWVSRGRKSRASAAGVGFLIGALGGGAIGLATGDDCDSTTGFGPCFSRGDVAAMLALVGGGLGGMIGLAVGGGEDWRRVPVGAGAALRFGPAPAPGRGVALVRLELPR